MDDSLSVATWLGLAATVIGLGSIVTQFDTIVDQTDQFHSLRDARHLGSWKHQQPYVPWYRLVKPPLVGPVLSVNLSSGLCGKQTVYISRLPLDRLTGQAAWSVLLAVIHSPTQVKCRQAESSKTLLSDVGLELEHIVNIPNEPIEIVPSENWGDIPLYPLTRHKLATCTIISRATLMALFCPTNARPVFHYSGAAGHRAAYPAYCGQWRVEWPIGELARVYFCAHDSHSLSHDVYPTLFQQRVDKCLQMLAGVVSSQTSNPFNCAFPGRKSSGNWVLQYAIRAFGGAHSGRHFYNMIGGNVNEVDFLFMNGFDAERTPSEDMIILKLPSKEGGKDDVTLYVPNREMAVLNKALDKLPWTFLSWSIHRGLRDILVAFAKQRMDSYRALLADTLRFAVGRWPEKLDARGWDPRFVRVDMADMAASAVLAGQGNSGDAVRVVTEIAAVFCDGKVSSFDETTFWRHASPTPSSPTLGPMAVVALVKCFVLEWSVELDYQMYHDFPLELYLG